jgi:hypothetical protein
LSSQDPADCEDASHCAKSEIVILSIFAPAKCTRGALRWPLSQFCHPEAPPKDLLVEICQVKVLRCTQHDKFNILSRFCEVSPAILRLKEIAPATAQAQ